MSKKWLSKIHWGDNGLVPVTVQGQGNNDVLMFALANREALQETAESDKVMFWSCPRKHLQHKGEESGRTQRVYEVRLDYDEDVVLPRVIQVGGIACHTGRHACFSQKFEGNVEGGGWHTVGPALKNPDNIYTGKPGHSRE